MKILITGICGFVGSSLVDAFAESGIQHEVIGLDNLSRPGSELNRAAMKKRGVKLHHGDLRVASDIDALPGVDWIIDAAANASVLAGVDGETSTRQLVEHNLFGTVNLLEHCKRSGAGLILLSTSRVYSIAPLARLAREVVDEAYRPVIGDDSPQGLTADGLTEGFSTLPPLSLYGTTKLSSELLALEYGEACGFPVWINRCGVLAGARQFGRADQGIFAYWLHSWRERAPLRYIGFDGKGHQVRDVLHPRDLTSLLTAQMADRQIGGSGAAGAAKKHRIQNVSGGVEQSMSLKQLSSWCEERFGPHAVAADPSDRDYDLPWMVLSSARAKSQWDWRPETTLEQILCEIADFSDATPDWLSLTTS